VRVSGEFLLPAGYVFGDLTGEVELRLGTSTASGSDVEMTELKGKHKWLYKRDKKEAVDGQKLDIRSVDIEWSKDVCKKGNTFAVEADLADFLFNDGSGAATVTLILL